MLEKWLTSPAMLDKFLIDDSGRRIDRERFHKILKAQKDVPFGTGFF